MRRAHGLAPNGLVAVIAAALLAVACDSGGGSSFEPADATDTADSAAGVDTTPGIDVADPPLGEPEWRLVPTAALDPGEEAWRGVHGVELEDGSELVAAVGTNGTVALYDRDADAWSFRNVGAARELLGVWIEDRDTILVVGQSGLARRWDPSLGDGGDWLLANITGQEVDLYDVWGDHDASQWVCGDRGIVARWDDGGVRWDVKLFPGNELTGGAKLEAIWGTSPAEVFAVGNRIILRWNGADFDVFDPGEVHLRGVWGTRDGPVYAVGDRGTIVTFDRSTDTWTSEQVGFLPYWSVFGVDADDVYAGALNSNIAGLTADGWEIEFIQARPGSANPIPGDLRFVDVWGTAPDDLFLVTNGPSIVRRGRFPAP